MDNKQLNKTNAVTHAMETNTVAEETAVAVPTMPMNVEEENGVNPPANTKITKKKNKGKAKNSGAGNDMNTELKKLSQRRIHVAGAPKMPLNAYVRFMNDRREQLRREQPQRTALEHTKMIGEEWHLLTDEVKTPYMEAATRDKALYQEQMQKFLTEHPEVFAAELAKAKKVCDGKSASTTKEKAANSSSNNNSHEATTKKSNAKSTLNKQQTAAATSDPDDIPLAQVKRTPTPTPAVNNNCALPRPFAAGEIPIYTNEFIEHNRSTENELRTLRKTKTDLEQQNAVLEQHVDNTKAGHAKVMAEVTELKDENVRLLTYIKQLRQKVVSTLAGISLPPLEPCGLNVENVDKYIHHLSNMTSSTAAGGSQSTAMLVRVGDLLAKMDTTGLHRP